METKNKDCKCDLYADLLILQAEIKQLKAENEQIRQNSISHEAFNMVVEELKEDSELLKFLITMISKERGYNDCRDLDYYFECDHDCFSEECLKLIRNAIKKDMEKSIRLRGYEK